MKPHRHALWLLVLAAAPLPATAAVEQFAIGGSGTGYGYFFINWRSEPIVVSRGGCSSNICVSTDGLASASFLQATFSQSNGGGYFGSGGYANVMSRGWITIVADAPGGPSFVDATLNLKLTGSTTLSANQGGTADGSVKITVDTAASSAWLQESIGKGSSPPPTQASYAWRVDADQVGAALSHLPVGQPFQLTLGVESRGGAGGSASSTSLVSYRLGFFDQQTVLNLPAGYSAWSSDWSIDSNRYCPNGCAPIPEPASWALFCAGIALLPWSTRRLRRNSLEERT